MNSSQQSPGIVILGGVTIEFRPAPEGVSTFKVLGSKELFAMGGDDIEVSISSYDGQLKVNDRLYGSVSKGDCVVIEDGNVFVNGERRLE